MTDAKRMLLYLTVVLCLSISVWCEDPPCPAIGACHCEDSEKGKIINCRDQSLTDIPNFNASDEIFYELTFSSSSTCPGSSLCNSISTLPSRVFNGLKVKKIDFTKVELNNIATDAFIGLENYLEELLMSGDKTIGIPYSALPTLINLQSLHLENFRQMNIDDTNTIKQLHNLQNLTLTNIVSLQAIAEQAFQNSLPKLVMLKLISNANLNYFPTGAIRQLVTLQHLSFVQCGLKSVQLDAFAELVHLTELDLSHNSIANFEAGSRSRINDTLKYLNLFLNNLNETGLELILARTWPVLEEINLGNNKIRNLHGNMFSNMPRLFSIKLMYNEIKTVLSNSFSALSLMYHLDLSNNQIDTIEDGAFSHMLTLAELNLDAQHGNNILNLTKESVAGLESTLEILTLDFTELLETEIWRLVSDLRNIRHLAMTATGVTAVPNFVFSKSSMLMYLTLADNSISELQQESFYGLKDSLHTLDLQSNSLTSISECVFQNFSRLSQLYLKNNHIDCDCRLLWLHEKIKESMKTEALTEFFITIDCDNFNGQYLGNVNERSLVCADNYVAPDCKEITTTTSTTTTTTTTTTATTTPEPTTTKPISTERPLPTLTVVNSSIRAEADSIHVTWSINDNTDITGYYMSYQELGRDRIQKSKTFHASVTEYTITGLNSGSDYYICVAMELNQVIMAKYQKCIEVSTSSQPKPTVEAPQTASDIPIIVGSICGGIALIILIAAILCLLLRYRNTQQSSQAKPVVGHTFNTTEKPKLGYDSKRFYKAKKNTDSEKDIQVTVISNKDMDNTRISAGSYQTLNIGDSPDSKNNMSVNQNPGGSYENDVSFRQLPRTPYYSTNPTGYHNKGFNQDDPANHLYHQPTNTYYDMSETGI